MGLPDPPGRYAQLAEPLPGYQAGGRAAPTMRTAPRGESRGPDVRLVGDVPSVPPDALEQFAKRVILDALCDASRAWWLKRAEDFERARPVPGEYAGRATREELRQRWRELTEIADACRAKAAVCEPSDAATDLDNIWSEKAA